MTGLGLTRLTLAGLVIAALKPTVPDIVPAAAPSGFDLFWDVAPVLALAGVVFLIGVRIRQQRIAQQRDKDWRARRDLRSRGA